MGEDTQFQPVTVADVLDIIRTRAQECRENGDTDMRNILNTVNGIKRLIDEGSDQQAIREYFAPEPAE